MKPAEPNTSRKPYSEAARIDQLQHVSRRLADGASYRQIRQELDAQYPGIGLGTIERRADEALRLLEPHANAQRYRAVQLMEMDAARKKLRQALAAWSVVQRHPVVDSDGNPVLGLDGKPTFVVEPGDVDGLAKVVSTIIRLHSSEARLLGLDRIPLPQEELGSMTDDELFGVVLEWMTEHPDAVDQVRETLAEIDDERTAIDSPADEEDVVEYLWAAPLIAEPPPTWDPRWP